MNTITTVAAVRPADLRARREAAGLTQRHLAARAECSLSWIANAEGGYIPRSGPTLGRVLAALELALKSDDPALTGEAVKDRGDRPDARPH